MWTARSRERLLLAIVLVAALLLTECKRHDPSPKPSPSHTPTGYGDVVVPSTAVSDSKLLPDIGPATPWTAQEIAAVKTAGYGRKQMEALNQPGAAGMKALLTVLRESGVSVVDQTSHNQIVAAPKERSHGMWLQAGQVVEYGRLLTDPSTFSLNGLITLFATGASTFQAPESAWRGYFTAVLSQASSPSELAWRADLLADSGPAFQKSLTTGREYALTPVQLILLSERAIGDAWHAAAWMKAHLSEPMPTPHTLPHPRRLTHASNAGLGRGQAGTGFTALPIDSPSKGPCGGVPIPDWVYTATSDASGAFWDYIIKEIEKAGASGTDVTVATGKFLGKFVAWLGLAATVLNFLATKAFFNANISLPGNVTRTKLTTEDQYREQLSATFRLDPPAGLWANCLRLIAAIKGLDAAVPEPGPWEGATVRWTIEHGPGIFPDPVRSATAENVTDKDGTSRIAFAATRQDTDKRTFTQQVPNSVQVHASVDPDSMTSTANHIGQWVSNLIELALGVASGGLNGGVLDVAAKAVITYINKRTDFWSTTATVPITDWGSPQLRYTVRIVVNQPAVTDVSTGLCDQTVTRTSKVSANFQMQATVPLTAGAADTVGSAALTWVGQPAYHSSDSVSTTGGDPNCGGTIGQPGTCKTAPSGAVVTNQDLTGASPGWLSVRVENFAKGDQRVYLAPSGVSETLQISGNDCQQESVQSTKFFEGEWVKYLPSSSRINFGPLGFEYLGPFASGPPPAITSLTYNGTSADGTAKISEHLEIVPAP